MPRRTFAIEYPEDGHRCADLVIDLTLADERFAQRVAGAEMTGVERFIDVDDDGAPVGEGYVVALQCPGHAPHPEWTPRMTVLSSGKFAAAEHCGGLDDCFEDAGTVIDLVLADDESFRNRYADHTLVALGETDRDGNRIIGVGSGDHFVGARWREHVVDEHVRLEPGVLGSQSPD